MLGHANEVIADSTLSVPITSPATKRAHWKLLGTKILNLPKQLKSKVGSNYKKIKRRIPSANMFSTFLRYSRNPKDYNKNGTQVGGRTVNGEPVKQQFRLGLSRPHTCFFFLLFIQCSLLYTLAP